MKTIFIVKGKPMSGKSHLIHRLNLAGIIKYKTYPTLKSISTGMKTLADLAVETNKLKMVKAVAKEYNYRVVVISIL